MDKVSSLTICLNESEIIEEMLEYVQNVVNEIVIVDGGSTDGTHDIIKAFAQRSRVPVKLFVRPMPESFADQRNFAKSKCTGAWILHIDSDEKYSDSLEVGMPAMTARKEINGFSFPTWHHFPDDEHYMNTDADPHIRLFRNIPQIEYKGDIHEYIAYEGHQLINHPSHFTPITLKHVRYIPTVRLRHYGFMRPKESVEKKVKTWKEKWFVKSSEEGIPANEDFFKQPKPDRVYSIHDNKVYKVDYADDVGVAKKIKE